jgi:AcrR family transcriptional regulator
MGRRKKEPKSVHRENIASAAQGLFMKNGIEATSMDDIAKAAGYSKATLYVYFENKEEIVRLLVLESMKKLYAYIAAALEKQETTRARYDYICHGLVQYQEEFPFYFRMALDKINIDFESGSYLSEERETYRVGEEINEKIRQFLCDGIARGEIYADIKILPTIFVFWGMLSGLVQTAANKEHYIEKGMEMSKEEFLEYGFDTLYHSITIRGKTYEK